MLLTYMDESYTKERYYIVALMVPDDQAIPLTKALDQVVIKAARDYRGIRTNAELHGYDLFHGCEDWELLADKPRARIGIYNAAFDAIATHDVVAFARGVNIPGLKPRYGANADPPHGVVLSHLLERVDQWAEYKDERAIVIADEVDGHHQYRRDLWHFQRYATTGYRARQITRVVDTIHFVPSDASRLIQAADLIAFLHRRRVTQSEPTPAGQRAVDALWARINHLVRNAGTWFP